VHTYQRKRLKTFLDYQLIFYDYLCQQSQPGRWTDTEYVIDIFLPNKRFLKPDLEQLRAMVSYMLMNDKNIISFKNVQRLAAKIVWNSLQNEDMLVMLILLLPTMMPMWTVQSSVSACEFVQWQKPCSKSQTSAEKRKLVVKRGMCIICIIV